MHRLLCGSAAGRAAGIIYAGMQLGGQLTIAAEKRHGGNEQADDRRPTGRPSPELEQLRAKLAEAEQDRDEYLALAQRTQADFENYQKRIQREHAQELRYAHAPLAADLLPILDNLDRAIAAAKQAGETGPLVQGVAMVQTQCSTCFAAMASPALDAEGQPFDPNLHQAVMQQPRRTSRRGPCCRCWNTAT